MRVKTKKKHFDFDEDGEELPVEDSTIINSGLDTEGQSQKVLNIYPSC